MEWIETTGKSVEEAIDLALDRLGIHKDELEYETMEAGKKGVFGIGGSEARIKSRVKPKSRENQKIENLEMILKDHQLKKSLRRM